MYTNYEFTKLPFLKLCNIKSSKLNMDRVVRDLLTRYNIVLAGGAFKELLRGGTPSDYDLFFLEDFTQLVWVRDYLRLIGGFDLVFECPEGKLYTYKKGDIKIQLITIKPFKGVKEVIDSFDFSVTYFAYDGEYLYTNKQAIEDLRNKHLSLVSLSYPTATIKRLEKYGQRGYYTPNIIKEIVFQIMDNDFPEDDLFRLYID